MPITVSHRLLSFADQSVRLIYPAELQGTVDFIFADFPEGDAERAEKSLIVEHSQPAGTYSIALAGQEERIESDLLELPHTLLIQATTALVTDIESGLAFHAGAVATGGHGILIPGMAGIGKTMLTTWFLSRGYQYLTDELVCITGGQQALLTLKRPLSIKKSGRKHLESLFRQEIDRHRVVEGEIADLVPWQLFPAAIAPADEIIPRLLLFPEYRPQAEISVEALSSAQAGLLAIACLVNARNLSQHGFPAVARFCRSLPALRLVYGEWGQLTGVVDRLIEIIFVNNLGTKDLIRLTAPFNRSRYADDLQPMEIRPDEDTGARQENRTTYPIPAATPQGPARKLTIGMATYDDYDGVYFSIQSIRLFHPEVADSLEILVVDNHPDGPCGQSLKNLEGSIAGYRYVPLPEICGTAVRDAVFREAAGEFVLCIDCHVMIVAGALKRLVEYLEANPDTSDLLQGPMLADNLVKVSTHFEPVWRAGMYGTWGTDERGLVTEGTAFDIPMQGLGLFCCRRDAWPGFNPRFRGFGGEEGYIHEKFRRNGGRILCLPFLRWLHRFGRPLGVPYRIKWEDRIHNYMIGFKEVDLPVEPVVEHFKEHLGEESTGRIVAAVEQEMRSPFFFFDAVYCIVTDTKSVRWAVMRKRLRALGLETVTRVFPAVITPENHHIGCALSHRGIISRARKQKLGNVLVFEDDAIFLDETLHYLQHSVNELKVRDWNVFYLGGHTWGRVFSPAEGCSFLERPVGLTCTHALAYNRTVYDVILDELPDTVEGMAGWIARNRGIDQFLPGLDNLYVTAPIVASQLSILPQEKEEFRHRFTLGAVPSESG